VSTDATSTTAARTQPDADILNLGCGEDYRDGAWNVDISRDVTADEYVDLNQAPWPWPDDAFKTVIAKHVLEHLDPVPWGELERVLADRGTLILEYPIGHTRFEDTTHKQYWNVNTAKWIAGNRKHGHERQTRLNLLCHRVEYDITPADPIVELRTRWKLWKYGAGPWLSQVTGLYGHVRAQYDLKPEGDGA